MARTATIRRNTKETQITLRMNLDGRGKSEIATGIPFFDHMLDLVTRRPELNAINAGVRHKSLTETDERAKPA